MRRYEDLRAMINNHIIMLEELEGMLKTRFVPWFKKRAVLLGDIQKEEADLIHYIETELLENLGRQRHQAEELHKEISKLCEKSSRWSW